MGILKMTFVEKIGFFQKLLEENYEENSTGNAKPALQLVLYKIYIQLKY